MLPYLANHTDNPLTGAGSHGAEQGTSIAPSWIKRRQAGHPPLAESGKEHDMAAMSSEEKVQAASDWWSTEIIDIHPGEIAIRGYPIQSVLNNFQVDVLID